MFSAFLWQAMVCDLKGLRGILKGSRIAWPMAAKACKRQIAQIPWHPPSCQLPTQDRSTVSNAIPTKRSLLPWRPSSPTAELDLRSIAFCFAPALHLFWSCLLAFAAPFRHVACTFSAHYFCYRLCINTHLFHSQGGALAKLFVADLA